MSGQALHVALVGPLPPPAGGMANQTRQLAELLRGEGLEVTLVQTNRPYVPAWLGAVRGLRALGRLLPYLADLWQACGRADVMHLMANSGWAWHLFAAPALWVARRRQVPVVVNYRGGGAPDFLARSAGRVRPQMQRAAALVVPSGFLQDVFARFGITASIVPNVVDLRRFSPGGGPTPAPADGGGPHLVVTRNLEPVYDNATALRAFAIVHQRHAAARLTVAGSGPERPALEALAAELGIAAQVVFAGRLDRGDMANLYRSATLMLNPSRTDNTPNSVLEAWACAVPVVSTRVGGVPYLVDDGRTGILVPPQDPAAMAAAALSVIEQPALRAGLAEAGRREAQRYTWEQVRPQLLATYRRVLPPAAARRA